KLFTLLSKFFLQFFLYYIYVCVFSCFLHRTIVLSKRSFLPQRHICVVYMCLLFKEKFLICAKSCIRVLDFY
uniref:Uncharacterized protein n=1 Tax=Ciona intestinalis TaxID=7719 RepID=H2XKQ5_CIOIN